MSSGSFAFPFQIYFHATFIYLQLYIPKPESPTSTGISTVSIFLILIKLLLCSTNSKVFSITSSVPCISTVTLLPGLFLTHPAVPTYSAASRILRRNPQPWTFPQIIILFRTIILFSLISFLLPSSP